MKHEDKKRELAAKATPGPRYAVDPTTRSLRTDKWQSVEEEWRVEWTFSPEKGRAGWETDSGCPGYAIPENDARLAAFHDPETVLLEAEVIAAARDLNIVAGPEAEGLWRRLRMKFEALDAHHARRNGETPA